MQESVVNESKTSIDHKYKRVARRADVSTQQTPQPERERQALLRYLISSLACFWSNVNQLQREVLWQSVTRRPRETMKTEFQTLWRVGRCIELTRLSREQRLHDTVVQKRRRYHTWRLRKNNAPHFLCSNKTTEKHNDSSSPAPDFSVTRLRMRIAEHMGWHTWHYDMQSAFRNGKLNPAAYTELPMFVYDNDFRMSSFIELECCLLELKDDMVIWHDLWDVILNYSTLNDFQSYPWTSTSEGMMKLFTANVYLMFADRQAKLKMIKHLLKKVTFRDLGRRTHFLW